MSSFNRRTVLLGSLATALAGCGFTPAYGPGGSATQLNGTILVDEPTTRPAYLLTRHLEDRLGRASNAQYGLSYAINISESAIAISPNDVTLRYNVLGDVTYALRDLGTGAVVTSGKVDSFTSYSTTGTTVATQASQKDAENRLMTILGDQIVTRLIVAAPGLPA
ncbi:LPS assembly lipoprotein LptE [Roseovarius sp. 2305UL8-3]|uniref:LPS assembly lipoprotein LptE n=1 Tax=Roseovarius conchicola TaxID=3121636 RepID=UPI00352767B4